MKKFHVNANGEAGACSAVKGNCPFGGESEHFTSADAARQDYEAKQGSGLGSTSKKSGKAEPPKTKEEFFNGLANVPSVADSKIVAGPRVADNEGYMGGRRYIGAKAKENNGYTPQREASEGLKEMVRQAKAAGELPKWLDVSVRKNSGAWVTSIDVQLGYKPEGGRKVRAIPQEWIYQPRDPDAFMQREKMHPEVEHLSKYIDILARSYESSDMNSSVDYFSTSNAGHVVWRRSWEDKD